MTLLQYLVWNPAATLTDLGLVLQVLGIGCFFYFWFKRAPAWPSDRPMPMVTVIKPAVKADDGEEENFKRFFEQKYAGAFELLFVISDEMDPVAPIIRHLLREYPDVNARLILSKTRKANWPKIDALYDAHKEARGEVIIWSDSDVIVQSDYVQKMVEALYEPGVAVVTVPQYDTAANNFASALKVLGNNADVASYMMIYNSFVRRKEIAFGHSIAFKRAEFDAFGERAWERLSTNLADDLELPRMFRENGQIVVHRNIYCPVQFANKTISQIFRQQEKFSLCQRSVTGRWQYLAGVFVFPQIWATVHVLATGYSASAIYLFLAVMGLRVFLSFLFEALVLRSVAMTVRYFWTIPIWDLLHLYFMLYAFMQDKIVFNGKVYQIKNLDELEVKS